MCCIQRPIFVRNWRRWTALGLLRAQKDTDLKRVPPCLEWHEGGVGTETPPRQSLLMLKVGMARSEAGGIAGTRYGFYPEGDGEASHGRCWGKRTRPSSGASPALAKAALPPASGEEMADTPPAPPSPFPCPRLLSSDSVYPLAHQLVGTEGGV